ncbi:hypothetical protein LRS13_13855 [Svornostia abyssi]|uniref:Type IV secretion system coupling protein TraD DNA-binding domain-containing protein n=1 Tax=Svornostia abyssi TaxID=2898438 RepID=A0ABY5PAV5_9ACTN|nr:hypothetical protein LRS13_13855 [Parviterribacteraceae bacterium J379]
MNGELIPALVAAGGGTALLGGIAWHEHSRERAMRASRVPRALRFPAASQEKDALALLGGLTGLGRECELVLDVIADSRGIRHVIHVPSARVQSIESYLDSALSGGRLDELPDALGPRRGRSVAFAPPTLTLLRTDEAAATSRALLATMARLGEGERMRLSWAIRPGHVAPIPKVPVKDAAPFQRLEHQALLRRSGEAGFLVAGLLTVSASPERARELSDHVLSVIRGRRSVGPGVLVRRRRGRSAELPSTYGQRGWLSSTELLPLLAWPLGDDVIPGVEPGVSRRLLVPASVTTEGRRLFVGRDARGDRPVALTAEAARHHSLYVGPSGVGKSVLLARGILSDIAGGYGGILIDPKQDLAADVLDRIRPEDAERIVVLEPGKPGPVPGLDLFSSGDPDLRADVILGALGAIFRDHWGPRTESYLRLGLATLSVQPRPVLTDWMRLFADAGYRRSAVARLHDPLLKMEWARFESLSAAEQAQHIAAPVNRLVSLLSRPALRNVLAQEQPKLDIPGLLAARKWLIVSLSPGSLGEPATRLLGAVIMYAAWSAIEQRASLPPMQRHPVFLAVDELQTLSSLPFGLEFLLERARGLGCGVTVATQGLRRLPGDMRASLLTNAATLVAFRQSHDEAERLARELPGVTAADLKALRPFEVAARVASGAGSAVSVVTGTTEPPMEATGMAGRIRELSAGRYGGVATDLAAPPVDADVSPEADLGQIGRVQ